MDSPADLRAAALLTSAAATGQGHVFDGWESLDEAQRKELLDDVKAANLGYLSVAFKASMEADGRPVDADATPLQTVLSLTDATDEQRTEWRRTGLEMIAQGRAAVLLLAGGQGTRLGSSAPKGCYNVGLPSGMSLFQIQAERVKKVQLLAAAAVGPQAVVKQLQWYIMTSRFTHEETLAHFEAAGFFGLSRDQVHFFQQGFLPCLTEEGKIIMETNSRIAKAPDGNGGVYMALHRSGCLAHMEACGVERVDVYCVDNILARVADPLFLGYCSSSGAQLGAKAVAKAHPGERVGVFASRGGALSVLEYSELDASVAGAPDPARPGRLLYNWANICMHCFSVGWLRGVADALAAGSAYHVARKKIPSKDGPVSGIKLERFIFDPFPLADANKVVVMEVERAAEFAPVKNAPGSESDSPDTARAAVLTLHRRWVEAAGGAVACDGGLEIAPGVSYAGEGLKALCAGGGCGAFSSPRSEVLLGIGPAR